ncbi:hypothetical protein EG327_008714 [Venturia inaequalis]|uniref:Uncharacterized protein n=2 Tax=Venturia inaequalis TaxID=5025 RepID=A0A8H3UPF5_VENIN|nr:hypothetical protein EG327_008714 [Venturia inaequalis]
MDAETTKKAMTGSTRHSTPSLMRRISNRLSAPVRSENKHAFRQNKHAFRQNEHAYSGETSQTTSLNEHRGITKHGSLRSLMKPFNTSKSSRPPSAASNSVHSRQDSVVPTRPTSSVETLILGTHKISGPVISVATSSSILQKYSSDQLIYVGRREDMAERFGGEETDPFESNLPASLQNPTSPPLIAVPEEVENGPLESLPPVLDTSDLNQSPSEYISPRSQWTMTIPDLLTKEEQTPANTIPKTRVLSHEHQASIDELRQYLRDSIRSSTTTNATETSTPRTSVSEEIESSVDRKYSGPIFEEPCCACGTVARKNFTDGPTIAEGSCVVDADTLSNFSADPTDADNKVTDGPIFEEPSCVSDTDSLSDHSGESSAESCDLQLLNTSILFPRSEDMFKKTRTAEETEEDQAILLEESTFTNPLSLSNPLFRQALQPSPEEEDSFYERQNPSQPTYTPRPRFRQAKQPSPEEESEDDDSPTVDPLLHASLSRSQDVGPSGEEMRRSRDTLVTKILSRNPEKWCGGADHLDVRISRNKRAREIFEAIYRR